MPKKKRDSNKKIILGIVVVLIIGAIFFLQNPNQSSTEITGELQNSESTGIDIGDVAPDFILENVEGGLVQLSSLRGEKVVVVNFWASWCPPCREEFPAFEQKYLENRNDVEIIGVNLQESVDAINSFQEEVPVSFPLVLDPTSDVKQQYNVFTQPVTYFLDENGVIVDKKFGPLTESEIEEKFSLLGIN